jgi:hypothetical protein
MRDRWPMLLIIILLTAMVVHAHVELSRAQILIEGYRKQLLESQQPQPTPAASPARSVPASAATSERLRHALERFVVPDVLFF